jgi:diguanylate cyclase (GGDEF)-like protein/PAS domain S-box-containing protein
MNPDLYKDILDNLFDGVYLVDRNRRILYWNRGAERISGYTHAEVQGRSCADNILMHITADGALLCQGSCPLSQTLRDGHPREDEVFLHHKDGHRVPISVRISPVRDESGAISGAVEVFSDATNRRRVQEELGELKRLSLADPLTGLGNRRSVVHEFERRLAELKRFGINFGVLFLDIDGFKRVNDTHGHEAGDRVLAAVGRTLKSALRGQDTVCRWGGEEFLAIIPRVDEATFRNVAERMRRFVEASPINLPGGRLSVTVSVGGALAQPDDTLNSLASRADALMYKAKQCGRNCSLLDCSPPLENLP